jgi:Zn-dependent protease with chaperone function
MKNTITYSITILLILVSQLVFCQTQKDYTPLRSIGVPPEHMSHSAIEKTNAKEITTSPYRPRNERLAEVEFYAASSYSINDLLVSGDVIYGEKIHEYLTKLLDHILKANKIDKVVQIHPVKSSVFNAFATEESILFINIGLLRQVRNEAELAFVVCHELAHYLNRHSLEGYLQNYKLETMKENSSMTSYEKILNKHSYSRNMENAADSIGLIYFKNTDYSLNSAVTVFDFMDNGFEQFSFADINSTIDFNGYYKTIPQNLIDSLDKIYITDSVKSEELSTHPETHKRKKNVIDWLNNESKGQDFVQSKADFEEIKKISLLESLRLSLIEGNFFQAYFISHIIQQQHPEFDIYAKKQMLKALVGLLDMRFPSGDDRTYEINEVRLNKHSSYKPIVYYFSQKSEQDIINEISTIIDTELTAGNGDEEFKALNNWYIRKVEQMAKEKGGLSTILKSHTVKESSFSNKKKIFLDPYFLSIDFRKVYMLDYKRTEKEQMKVKEKMDGYLKIKDNYSMISIADKSQLTSDLLYEKDIITKRLMEIDNSSNKTVAAFPTDYNEVNEICKKYDSQKVSVTFAATAYYKSNSSAGVLLLFFFAPLGIYLMTTPSYITFAEYSEFDLVNGTIDNERSLQKKSKFSGSPVRDLYYPRNK